MENPTAVLLLLPKSVVGGKEWTCPFPSQIVTRIHEDDHNEDGNWDCAKIVSSFPTGCFDIVVDTTKNSSRTQQMLLSHLFPLVRPGGQYVILTKGSEKVPDVLEDGSNDTAQLVTTLRNTGRWNALYATGEQKRFLEATSVFHDVRDVGDAAPGVVLWRRLLSGAIDPCSLTHGIHSADAFIVPITFAATNATKLQMERHASNISRWLGQGSSSSSRIITYRGGDREFPPFVADGWRTVVLLSAIEAARENSLLAFFEQGSDWHAPASQLLKEMGDADILAAQLEEHPERAWTDAETFSRTGTAANLAVQQSNQIAATCLLIRANARTRAFVRYWHAMNTLCASSSSSSAPSPTKLPGFVDHRYAQSVLSILLKTSEMVRCKLVPFSWLHFVHERMDVTPDVRVGKPRIDDHGFWHGEGADQQHAYDPGLGEGLATFFSKEGARRENEGSKIKRRLQVIDFGCGRGEYIKKLNKDAENVEAVGVDGNPATPALTDGAGQVADLATELDLGVRDWVMSIEVAEHLPPQFESSFLKNVHKHNREGVVLSWAVPGQGGHGHFNEQPNEYVREKFREMGYISDKGAEVFLRNSAHFGYLKQTIMVFRKQ